MGSFYSKDDSSCADVSVRGRVKRAPSQRQSQVNNILAIKKFKTKEDGLMINQYVIEEVLGKGMYSTVKKCKDKVTGRLYAIKVMNKKLLMSKR